MGLIEALGEFGVLKDEKAQLKIEVEGKQYTVTIHPDIGMLSDTITEWMTLAKDGQLFSGATPLDLLKQAPDLVCTVMASAITIRPKFPKDVKTWLKTCLPKISLAILAATLELLDLEILKQVFTSLAPVLEILGINLKTDEEPEASPKTSPGSSDS